MPGLDAVRFIFPDVNRGQLIMKRLVHLLNDTNLRSTGLRLRLGLLIGLSALIAGCGNTQQAAGPPGGGPGGPGGRPGGGPPPTPVLIAKATLKTVPLSL